MARPDDRPVVHFRDAVPTTKHAATLLDLVVERLGERAVVQRRGKSRRLFLRAGGDGQFLLPWPILSLDVSDPPPGEDLPSDEVRVLEIPKDPPGGPAQVPFEFHPIPAQLMLHDGTIGLTVNYGWRGRFRDCVEPAERDAFADLIPALAKGSDNRLELLADYVVAMDIGRHGPGRVLLPRMTPGGAEGAWMMARFAIRDAMATRSCPPGSFWAVADGYVGTARAFGARRADALAAWRAEVEKVRPAPRPPADRNRLELPSPDAPPSWEATEWSPDAPSSPAGSYVFFALGWDAPPFDPSPASMPGGIVRVAALPTSAPPRGVWTRWLGDFGTTHFAARIPSDAGFLLVGDRLLADVELSALDGVLADADEGQPGPLFSGMTGRPAPTHAVVYYRCRDAGTGAPIPPRREMAAFTAGFDPRHLDVQRLRTHLVRVRPLE